MKKILFIFLLLPLAFCKNKPSDEGMNNCPTDFDEGTIFLYDLRLCPCCGGWFIKIDDDTLRIAYGLSASFDSVLAAQTLPVAVCLKWLRPDSTCMPDMIEVGEIELK